MIAFVVALKNEAKYLINDLDKKIETKLLDKPCYLGKINNQNVVIAISGIGKVSAALTTQKLIDEYKPKVIINFGSAGGVSSDIEIGTYYQIDSCCQPDFDVTEIDDVDVGYIQEYDRVYFDTNNIKLPFLNKKRLATTDKFCSKQEFINLLIKMGCNIRDMEGSAIAQVCTSNQQPLIIIKGITDVYGSGNDGEQFVKNLDKICKGFPELIKNVIYEI